MNAISVLVGLAVAGSLLALQLLLDKRRAERFAPPPRIFGDLIYRPIDAAELPPSARKYFDSVTGDLITRGFNVVGDYLAVHEPRPMYCRLLTRPGATFAGIAFMRGPVWMRIRAFSLYTVFEDGCLLETVTLPPTENTHRPQYFRYQFLPFGSVEAAETLHERGLAEHRLEHPGPAITYPPEQLAEVHRYYTELALENLSAHGEVEWPPRPREPHESAVPNDSV